MGINIESFFSIFNYAHRGLFLDNFGIFLAVYLPYILIISALILIFTEHGWKRRVFFAGQLIIVLAFARGMIIEAIHFFYPTLRPFEALEISPLIYEQGFSFPSSHATILFGLSLVVWYMNRKWGSLFIFLAGLNALARVFAGVHFPIDVLAGAMIGLIVAKLSYDLMKAYLHKISMPDEEFSEGV